MSSPGLVSLFDTVRRLSTLTPGVRGTVMRVHDDAEGLSDRLAALGVTHGASIRVLQTFPAFVFACDETELAVEPAVAHSILIVVA